MLPILVKATTSRTYSNQYPTARSQAIERTIQYCYAVKAYKIRHDIPC